MEMSSTQTNLFKSPWGKCPPELLSIPNTQTIANEENKDKTKLLNETLKHEIKKKLALQPWCQKSQWKCQQYKPIFETQRPPDKSTNL